MQHKPQKAQTVTPARLHQIHLMLLYLYLAGVFAHPHSLLLQSRLFWTYID
jgi:hypothetical protein